MKIESWQEKFYRISELYLESDGVNHYLCGELKRSQSEMKKRFNQLSEVQQEALKDSARMTVSKIMSGEDEVKPKPFTPHNLMELRRSRKERIAKKVIEIAAL